MDSLFNNYTSTYTYDKRGNITSKNKYSFTRDDTASDLKSSTVYEYDNEQWLDQLTAVNGTPLTYDASGNLASYGDTDYTWSHGKWLSSVKDGENTYTYRYDENGIRASKTVNGVKTEFNTLNGVLLSQKTGSDFIYFQYDTNGTPIGFVYNDTQYLYMTNQLGDVLGIADMQGNELLEYEYDEWGNPLETTLMSDDEIASVIAEINPFRYRGYYYDNETGMYYLQSRYYNPEWGRFISADDFSYIDSKPTIKLNTYAYCGNNPIKYIDPTGHVSELGIDIAEIISAIFVCYDALHFEFSNISFINKRNSEDFACFIAALIVTDKSVLYPSGNSSEEKHNNFVTWMNNQAKYFEDLVKTTFYCMTLFCTDFFFKFYEIVVNEKTFFANININRFVSLSFGYAYDDETLEAITDALESGLSGHFKWVSNGDFSSGVIISPPSNVGAYIEYSKNLVGNFYGFLDLGVEIDITKLFPQISGFEISTELQIATAAGVAAVLLAWIIESLSSAVVYKRLVPVL